MNAPLVEPASARQTAGAAGPAAAAGRVARPARGPTSARKPVRSATGDESAERTVVAFCCRECAYAAADASANARTPLPPSVRLVLVPCSGRVSPLHMLTALAEGADGVMVAGCLEGQCHYREGNFNAIDRVTFVQRLLESVGVEPQRARMFTMSAGEPPKFVAAVREMDRTVQALPPLERRP
jgi:F420-non-reducing hydrogenase iron-sulfur subunit